MIVLVYSRPLTSKLAETLSCLNRDLTDFPSRSNTSQDFPLPWPKGLIDFWLVVLFKPLYSMTSSFEWQLIRLHNSMGICLDTGNLHKVPIRDRYAGLPINLKVPTVWTINVVFDQNPTSNGGKGSWPNMYNINSPDGIIKHLLYLLL